MIAIIDYGVGNLHSVLNAFNSLNIEAFITSNKEEILASDKVVLPGVGAFSDAMEAFKSRGFEEVIMDLVKNNIPLLGICVGMQMMLEVSYEYGIHKGLGLFNGSIDLFNSVAKLKVPHIGWNQINITKPSKLFNGVSDKSFVYFVHSYRLEESEYASSKCTYGNDFVASIEKDNIYGVQFHPEKSGEIGLKILKNFGEL